HSSCRYIVHHHTAPPQVNPLSLHDALPILGGPVGHGLRGGQDAELRRVGPPEGDESGLPEALGEHHVVVGAIAGVLQHPHPLVEDRKSTRLNSSHLVISYAVFCLKKKKG